MTSCPGATIRRRDSLGELRPLTSQPGTDTDVVLATAPDGRVWMAWQGWRDGQADVWLAPVDDPAHAVNVSESSANEWSPALAVGRDGSLHVAYDTYLAGNYDVLLRTRRPDGALGKPVAVASSPKFEVRPSLAVDNAGASLGGLRGADRRLGQGRSEPDRGQGIEPLPPEHGARAVRGGRRGSRSPRPGRQCRWHAAGA